jgi:hypothetical protein
MKAGDLFWIFFVIFMIGISGLLFYWSYDESQSYTLEYKNITPFYKYSDRDYYYIVDNDRFVYTMNDYNKFSSLNEGKEYNVTIEHHYKSNKNKIIDVKW